MGCVALQKVQKGVARDWWNYEYADKVVDIVLYNRKGKAVHIVY